MTGNLFIKVCGITRREDAELAAELGASAVGFIFWEGSPRYIEPAKASAIIQALPAEVTPVGVFVDAPVERVSKISQAAGVRMIQLHGAESPAYCRQIRGPVIKAVGLTEAGSGAIDAWAEEVVVLLDAHDPVRHGGTGRTIDWAVARRIAATRRTILSGGLHAGNIGSAIEAVQPYGIDVSSGVESTPGVKDATRVKDFFAAVRRTGANVG